MPKNISYYFLLKRKIFSKNAFSLIELLIVVGVIGVLSAIAVPNYFSYRKNAQIKADKALLLSLNNAALFLDSTDQQITKKALAQAVTKAKIKDITAVGWKENTERWCIQYTNAKTSAQYCVNEEGVMDDTLTRCSSNSLKCRK